MDVNPTNEVGDDRRCDTECGVCDTDGVPTTKPRYTITDTGETAELLDKAARVWPEIDNRRELLLRVLEAGREAVEVRAGEQAAREARQLEALTSGNEGLDVELLLSNAAWR